MPNTKTDTTSSDTSTAAGPTTGGPTASTGPTQRLWAALLERPGTTPAELAAPAGMGATTAGKILARWAKTGHAHHTPGDTPRAAHHWTATHPNSAPETDPEATVPDPASGSDPAPELDVVADPACESDIIPAAAPRADDVPDPAPTPELPDAASEPDAVGPVPQPDVVPETGPEGEATGDVGAPGEELSPEAGMNRSGSARLGSGALRGMVEDYLADHPGEHGPAAIATALGRSSGAVANACERLVDNDTALRTNDKPRRYQHTEDNPTDPEHPDHHNPDSEEPDSDHGKDDGRAEPATDAGTATTSTPTSTQGRIGERQGPRRGNGGPPSSSTRRP